MSKQSGFLRRQEGRTNLFISYAERLMQQYMMDTLQIAIHREFGFGYGRIMRLCDTWKAVREEYKAACINLGRRVTFDLPDGSQGAGEAVDVDAEGRLVVRTDTGEQHVFTGEVSVHGIYGAV